MRCPNCEKEDPIVESKGACPECFQDPETNNCTICDNHLQNIPYPYVCGECIHLMKVFSG